MKNIPFNIIGKILSFPLNPWKVDEIHPMGKFWYGINCRQNSEEFIPFTHLLDGGKNLLLYSR
jgi:hypothetical protein